MTGQGRDQSINKEASVRVVSRPWSWRIPLNHGFFDEPRGTPTFHAYDVNDNAACEPMYGLSATAYPANEGSHLCPKCLDATSAQPEGRAVRTYPSAEEFTDA